MIDNYLENNIDPAKASSENITDVDLDFWKSDNLEQIMENPQFWCKQTEKDKFVPITPNYEQPTHRIEKGGFVSINA